MIDLQGHPSIPAKKGRMPSFHKFDLRELRDLGNLGLILENRPWEFS